MCMMNGLKKGQAAMEFLTTYGWMLIVVMVVVGGMWQFGVFTPSTWVKSSCQLDNKLSCDSFSFTYDQAQTNYTFQIELVNLGYESMQIQKIKLSELEGEGYCLADVTVLNGESNVLASQGLDQQKDFQVSFNASDCDGFSKANFNSALEKKRRFDISIYYTTGDSTLPEVSSGKLITEIVRI